MKHPEYKNRMLATQLWKKIATTLPGDFGAEEIKEKCRKMRESYSKSKTYVSSGSAAKEKKEHKYLHQMKFLDDVIGYRKYVIAHNKNLNN